MQERVSDVHGLSTSVRISFTFDVCLAGCILQAAEVMLENVWGIGGL